MEYNVDTPPQSEAGQHGWGYKTLTWAWQSPSVSKTPTQGILVQLSIVQKQGGLKKVQFQMHTYNNQAFLSCFQMVYTNLQNVQFLDPTK